MTLEHVVFSNCKLDYAVLSRVGVTGPVLFVQCSLREAEFRGCDLARSLLTTATWGWLTSGLAATGGATCAATTCPR